jgi:hypothetical protein
MKRKYLHAKHLPPQPSCRRLGLGRPRWRFMRVSLNKSYAPSGGGVWDP